MRIAITVLFIALLLLVACSPAIAPESNAEEVSIEDQVSEIDDLETILVDLDDSALDIEDIE